jgi:hypothetical protein
MPRPRQRGASSTASAVLKVFVALEKPVAPQYVGSGPWQKDNDHEKNVREPNLTKKS